MGTGLPNPYIRRTLLIVNDDGRTEQITDRDLAASTGSAIVLGEPGMGKTQLLREIARESGCECRSAASFVAHPNPTVLVSSGRRLLIDGLDELLAARESDPVNRVLGQLIRAGCPPFLLSCRAADWRGAVARRDIADAYGTEPRQVSLEPLSRDFAIAFLTPLLGANEAAKLIDDLEAKSIPDLYGNPLSLLLFGRVAAAGGRPPLTRAELLRQACDLMWSERADGHDRSPLARLDRQTALASAGAISAAYILTGAQAVTLKPSSTDVPGTIRAAELQSLPHGAHAATLIGSRLFVAAPEAQDQFRPIHRSIAEYLGGRWLAQSIRDDMARERVLAMLTVDGGPPASLRGIHAWLAQDSRFTDAVIAADPYGLLRYGDADCLSVDQGRKLLRALRLLQRSDPNFRAGDYGHHAAVGLTHTELLGDVREILLASDTTFDLRTLLLSSIRGSALARTLKEDLRSIVLSENGRAFSFAERSDAATVLVGLDSPELDHRTLVERLIEIGDHDSTRLAMHVMADRGFEKFEPDAIARTILVHLGLLGSAGSARRRRVSGAMYALVRHIPDPKIEPVLEALARLVPSSTAGHGNDEGHYELANLVARLTARQVDIESPDPLRLLRWLRLMSARRGSAREYGQRVSEFLRQAHSVRRAIQLHVIFNEGSDEPARWRTWLPSRIDTGTELSADDVIHFLAYLAQRQDLSDADTEIWRELAGLSRRFEERADEILEAARAFTRGGSALEAWLEELRLPPVQAEWEIRDAARRAREERSRVRALQRNRDHYLANEGALREGALDLIHPVSQVYLCLFSDVDRKSLPVERVGSWLGPELLPAALAGLEAVLSRPDIPTPQQVADSYQESRTWNFIFAMISGVIQRVLDGQGIHDVRTDIVISVLLGLHNEAVDSLIGSRNVAEEIEAVLRRDAEAHERYIRLLIEPSLRGKRQHIHGLYEFSRSTADHDLAVRLSLEWLGRYADLPVSVEGELIDIVAQSTRCRLLADLRRERISHGIWDDDRLWTWHAVGLLVDFDTMANQLGTISPVRCNLLWHIRHRLHGERRQEQPPPSIPARSLAWIVRQFRSIWPRVGHPTGTWSGGTNPWDAADFLMAAVNRLASDTSDASLAELKSLVEAPEDTYTPVLVHAAALQRRARREANFAGVTLKRLTDVIEARPPTTTDDLLPIVSYALARLQKELRGSDTDVVVKYWRDIVRPQLEDYCTDRLIEDVQRLLPNYGIMQIPQRDMPAGKRADIVLTAGSEAALPIECKCQWNDTLWSAAAEQLDAYYVRDWRAQDRGIYLVYWFGPAVSADCRLKPPPDGSPPSTPSELREQLLARLPQARRGSITVEVLDLSR